MRTLSALVVACLVAASVGLSSCGEETTTTSEPSTIDRGTTSVGLELFNERVIGSSPGCITCHSLNEGVTLVGPSLAGIGESATGRVSGMTAPEYLRQAIVDPDAFVVEDFDGGLMVGNWTELLTEEQIDSLVEVLLDS